MKPSDFYRRIERLESGTLLHLRVGYGLNRKRNSNIEDHIFIFGQGEYEQGIIKKIKPEGRRIVTIFFEQDIGMYLTEHRGTRTAGVISYNISADLGVNGYERILEMNKGEAAIQDFLRRQKIEYLSYVVRSVANAQNNQEKE